MSQLGGWCRSYELRLSVLRLTQRPHFDWHSCSKLATIVCSSRQPTGDQFCASKCRHVSMGRSPVGIYMHESRTPKDFLETVNSILGLRRRLIRLIRAKRSRRAFGADHVDQAIDKMEPGFLEAAGGSERSASVKLNHSVGVQRNSRPVTPFLAFWERNG
jgi:hypothetical protein